MSATFLFLCLYLLDPASMLMSSGASTRKSWLQKVEEEDMVLIKDRPEGFPGSASSPWGVCCRKAHDSRGHQISSTTFWSWTPASWTWSVTSTSCGSITSIKSTCLLLPSERWLWRRQQPPLWAAHHSGSPIFCYFHEIKTCILKKIIVGHRDPLSWLHAIPFPILQTHH